MAKKNAVDFDNIKEMAETLNETKLLAKKEKIDTDLEGDELVTAFVTAISNIPEAKRDQIPDEVFEAYEGLPESYFEEAEAADDIDDEPAEEPEEEEEKPTKKDKAKGKSKEKPAAKEKVKEKSKSDKGAFGRDPDAPKTCYGHMMGSMNETLDAMLSKGCKHKDLVAAIMKNHDRDKKAAEGKIKGHIIHLKKNRGVIITTKGEGDDAIYKADKASI